jgi:hypothetical protein
MDKLRSVRRALRVELASKSDKLVARHTFPVVLGKSLLVSNSRLSRLRSARRKDRSAVEKGVPETALTQPWNILSARDEFG